MSDKFNKNYQYQPKVPLTTKQIEEGIKNGDSRILSRTITLIESSNLNDRKLVYKALGNIPKTKNKYDRENKNNTCSYKKYNTRGNKNDLIPLSEFFYIFNKRSSPLFFKNTFTINYRS